MVNAQIMVTSARLCEFSWWVSAA